jgi:uncharacterized MAPEG superfamily protein
MLGRMERALNNSVTALAMFAPPILILALRQHNDGLSLICAQIFLIVRVLYVPSYVFNLVGLRTLLWLVGFACTVGLYLLAL